MSKNIFDVVAELDNAAKIPALRAITHSSMAKCIGSIRQDIRDRTRTERDEDSHSNSMDERNGFDEDERSVEQIANAMGFDKQMPPLRQASLFHAVYDWALAQLETCAVTKWDMPLTLDGMLVFMTEKAQGLDEVLVKALAEAAKVDPALIRKMHELQERQDREKLKEALPTIKLTFEGFGDNGYEDSINDLPAIAQHQMGIKVIESLTKAKDQVMMRIMRSRRLSDLANIPLIEEGIVEMSKWVKLFEEAYEAELREAVERGVNLRSIEEVTA